MRIENEVLSNVYSDDIVNGEFIIPNYVITIRLGVFYNCYKLKSITIPYSITEIEKTAFLNCENLKSINVTKDNKYYSSEDGVLFNKDKTKLIQYPEGKKGKKYTIPSSVIEIGEYSFFNCNNLKSIIITDSVTKIGNGAFAYCKNLQSKESNYKAFKKGLVCRDMQYKPNKWNTVDGDIEVCEWGLHYVTNLFGIFNYYHGNLEEDIEIWEVVVGDIIANNGYDSKKATNAIKPIKKLSREEIINILNNKQKILN